MQNAFGNSGGVGGGGLIGNSLCGRGMDIFWNHTMYSCHLFPYGGLAC